MNISGTKVAIIGTGNVGATTAYSLTVQGICSELVLIDRNQEKAMGEVLDLQHSIEYLNRNVRVSAGDYSQCQDAHIVVITASGSMDGVHSRLDLLDKNIPIMEEIVDQVMASGFNGYIIVVSNPVDVLSYYVYKRSGLSKSQVIGTGTSIETARLKQIIGERMRVDPRSVDAFAMGEHGDSQVVPWSHVRVGGKSFDDILEDNSHRFQEVDKEKIVEMTRMAGSEVLRRKGNTEYGIASATTGIIKSILRDENQIITVSTLLEGEYGEYDVYCGVPVILGKEGVIEIGEYRLTADEKEKFHASCEIIREHINKLSLDKTDKR